MTSRAGVMTGKCCRRYQCGFMFRMTHTAATGCFPSLFVRLMTSIARGYSFFRRRIAVCAFKLVAGRTFSGGRPRLAMGTMAKRAVLAAMYIDCRAFPLAFFVTSLAVPRALFHPSTRGIVAADAVGGCHRGNRHAHIVVALQAGLLQRLAKAFDLSQMAASARCARLKVMLHIMPNAHGNLSPFRIVAIRGVMAVGTSAVFGMACQKTWVCF